MSKPIIEINGVSKKYSIGSKEPYFSLRDVISGLVKSPINYLRPKKNVGGGLLESEFWALKDISFNVEQGEVIGIIGRNGAGKSTLLKLLSRITPPTTGEIVLRGRMASLLEVGTGFHPELTGRENIYLNGAILGMKRWEINNKFKQIIEFAEIEKFLDSPVKHYSSGMYMRLAFAVAAHLEPEILVVDEVLAVGDAEFQKKCLGKMEDVSKHDGRTILFVSHNLNAIEQLCKKIIWLDKGQVKQNSKNVPSITQSYLNQSFVLKDNFIWNKTSKEYENEYFDLQKIFLSNSNNEVIKNQCSNKEDFNLNIEFSISKLDAGLNIGYAIYSEDNQTLYWSCSTDKKALEWPKLQIGLNRLSTKIPSGLLNNGKYKVEIFASLHLQKWIIEPEKNDTYISAIIEGALSDSPYWISKRPGYFAPIINWKSD